MKEKENIVIVHSFPTNSILLNGLIKFLEEYFHVYFIDLPGFTTKVPAMYKFAIDGYASFLKNKIDELNLDHYVVMGISFGFFIINQSNLDTARCKGCIAVEPYIGAHSLKINFFKKFLYLVFLNLICSMNLHYIVWKSRWFNRYLLWAGNPTDRIHHTFAQVDAKTFFETGRLILKTYGHKKFRNPPYILIINRHDRTVNYDYLTKIFEEEAESVLVISTKMDHYPTDPTKDYFSKLFPRSVIEDIYRFIGI